MLSSVVEHRIADPAVTGSNPVVSCSFLVGVVGNISACHADARGSIPRLGVFLEFELHVRVEIIVKNFTQTFMKALLSARKRKYNFLQVTTISTLSFLSTVQHHKKVRHPRIELGPPRWQRGIIATRLMARCVDRESNPGHLLGRQEF